MMRACSFKICILKHIYGTAELDYINDILKHIPICLKYSTSAPKYHHTLDHPNEAMFQFGNHHFFTDFVPYSSQ